MTRAQLTAYANLCAHRAKPITQAGPSCQSCGNWIMDDDGDSRVNSDGQVWCGDCTIKADLDEDERNRPTLEEEDWHGC